ncbi:hypothetical protein C1H76_2665 [Elsinoe australis]|uniref:Uncharacterized protein n=1 Tax=Elsinoe australis TaxID=40998 RepID=A0A4U7B2N8_9PEZI|nr:hypothetical protein C1H76_2665 [Elsinoe australis]
MPLAVVNLLTLVSNPIPPPFFALHAPYALVALIVLLSLIDPCALLAFLARPSSLTIRSNGLSPNNGLYEGSLVLGAFEAWRLTSEALTRARWGVYFFRPVSLALLALNRNFSIASPIIAYPADFHILTAFISLSLKWPLMHYLLFLDVSLPLYGIHISTHIATTSELVGVSDDL